MNNAALFYGDDSCVVDPFKANRTYRLSGKGTPLARPDYDDTGAVRLSYGNADPSATGQYRKEGVWWPDYGTSFTLPNGRLVVESNATTTNNLPFKNMLDRSPFSMLMRIRLLYMGDNQTRFIRNVAQGTGGWGGSSQICQLYVNPVNSTQGTLVYDFATDTGDSFKRLQSPLMTVFNVPLEILITRDANNNTYFLVNGSLMASINVQPSSAQFWTEQYIVTGDYRNGGYSTYMNITDDTFYNVCIATGAYTPAAQPFC